MTADKTLSALALARRAGKLIMGFDAVMESARMGETVLVVLSCGLSPKTVKEASFHCGRFGVPFLTADVSLEEAEHVLGKRAGVFGVADDGFRTLLETAVNGRVQMD